MNLSIIKNGVERFVSENAAGLLTGGAVVGTVATAVLTARASFKAADLIEEEKSRRASSPDVNDFRPVTKVEAVKIAAPHFIPPVIVGAGTITATIMANRVNTQRVAALAAAYTISEGRMKDIQEKLKEKLTGPKEQQLRDEVAQHRVFNNPPTDANTVNRQIVILDGKTVLCHDQYSGRYFHSTMENIKRAELSTNAEIANHGYASLSYFYDELEIPPTGFSDQVGWNSATTGPMDLTFTTVMSPDQKPCLAFDFVMAPGFNYATMY